MSTDVITMSYNGLHFDAKTAIARVSISAWNALMRADPVFGRYALSDGGRASFIATFTVVKDNEWTVGGKLHRTGGPAFVCADSGGEVWYEYGEPHRIDGPASSHSNSAELWWKRGRLHRIGGPAIKYGGKREDWYENGELHRVGGPARTYVDGSTEWHERGKLHRIGGPARVLVGGAVEWYAHGICHPPPDDR